MGSRLPTTILRRPSAACSLSRSSTTTPMAATTTAVVEVSAPAAQQQVRHATYVLRHRRPYQFTQLVQLSDGSTYTMRTTSPVPLYRSTKDTRNHILWQPSETSLRNVEVDEAGKLAAFRARFGRGWDSAATPTEAGASGASAADSAADTDAPAAAKKEEDVSSLSDLISGYAARDESSQDETGSHKAGGGKKKK